MTDHDMYSWAIKTFNPHRPAEVVSLMRRLINVQYMLHIAEPDISTLDPYYQFVLGDIARKKEILTALKQLKHWHSYCHKYQIKIQHRLCKVGVTGTWNGKRKASMPSDIQLIETATRSDHGRRELHV